MISELLSSEPLIGSLAGVDLLILMAATAMLFVIAYFVGRQERDTRDYFLGGRRVPGIVACLSFVATEVSALTIVGVPAVAYAENWHYLQFFLGSAAARIVVAYLFIPVFFRLNCTTIYEFLRHRFGPATQYAGSAFFFITRLIASGVRLYAACLGVGIIMNWPLPATIAVFTAVSVIFIAFGGIKAVVWNGAYQAVMFYVAGMVVLVYLGTKIVGPMGEAWEVAVEAGRLSVFDFSINLNDATTFWAGSINAFFIGLAVFGTDQELMQRLLTVQTRRASQGALMATIAAALPVICLYLAAGTLLFIFYQQHPYLAAPDEAKQVLSHFVSHSLPVGLKGLVLSAIVLASIDSPLMSLASSFVTDMYRPLVRPDASERHYLWVSRFGVIGFGIALAGIAWACAPIGNILWFAFEIISITGGSILGVFLLGLLTPVRANLANVSAMIINTVGMTALLLLSKYGVIDLAWSWLIVLGTVNTFVLATILAPIVDRRR